MNTIDDDGATIFYKSSSMLLIIQSVDMVFSEGEFGH